MTEPSTHTDILAIDAHPDDAEFFAGGTIALLAASGFSVRIVHLTRGETATRGTPETRASESLEAARILQVKERVILNLGDGRIENSDLNRRAVVEVLRQYRPTVVMTHGPETRHPDHARTHELVRDASFFANVGGYHPQAERHGVRDVVYWLGHEMRNTPKPDWIVDVSSTYDTKVKALQAYATQFYSQALTHSGPQTYLTSPVFWEIIESRARHWGHAIGARWGEPFLLQGTPHAEHPWIQLLTSIRQTPVKSDAQAGK